MKNSEEPSSASPRIHCSRGRSECNAKSGDPGSIPGAIIAAKIRKRIQAISIEGKVAERYFAVTSETPRNTVEARISAIPRNGRSARPGARRARTSFSGARGFAGDGGEARRALRLRRLAESRWALGEI